MEFIRLQTADTPLYSRARALYEESFPRHEQREDAAQREIMSWPDYHFTLIQDEEAFAGLVLFWDGPDFLYVEHLCILPKLRGRGCGGRVLSWLTRQGKPVILEIDPPVDSISIRRKGFYTRGGFRENPFPHVHPPYHRDCAGHTLQVLSAPATLSEALYRRFVHYLNSHVMEIAHL